MSDLKNLSPKQRIRLVVNLALGGHKPYEIKEQLDISIRRIDRILDAYYAGLHEKTTDRMRKEQEARLLEVFKALWKRFIPIQQGKHELTKHDFAVIDRMLHVVKRIVELYGLAVTNPEEDDPVERIRMVHEFMRKAKENDWQGAPGDLN